MIENEAGTVGELKDRIVEIVGKLLAAAWLRERNAVPEEEVAAAKSPCPTDVFEGRG